MRRRDWLRVAPAGPLAGREAAVTLTDRRCPMHDAADRQTAPGVCGNGDREVSLSNIAGAPRYFVHGRAAGGEPRGRANDQTGADMARVKARKSVRRSSRRRQSNPDQPSEPQRNAEATSKYVLRRADGSLPDPNARYLVLPRSEEAGPIMRRVTDAGFELQLFHEAQGMSLYRLYRAEPR